MFYSPSCIYKKWRFLALKGPSLGGSEEFFSGKCRLEELRAGLLRPMLKFDELFIFM